MTTPPVRELSHCWAHVHRQEPTQDRRPFRTQRRRPFWTRDERRHATTHSRRPPPPSCMMSSSRGNPSGRVADQPLCRSTPSVCARSPGAQDRRLHPIELSTSCPQQKSPAHSGAAAVFSDKVIVKTESREPMNPSATQQHHARSMMHQMQARASPYNNTASNINVNSSLPFSGEGWRQHFSTATAARRRPPPIPKLKARGDSCGALATYRHAHKLG